MKNGVPRFVCVACALALLMVFTACAKKTLPTKPEFSAGTAEPGLRGQEFQPLHGGGGAGAGLSDSQWRELGLNTPAERQEFMDKAKTFENDDVYFAFNGYVLSEEGRNTLERKVEFLKRYAKVKVIIEGHCDERGSVEYNLALGERRATSAYQYLLNSGIAAPRLSMISYGKERPLAPGHDEASWAKNRRAHFVLNF
jgi:peptidoglycan-associated lipoprotein